MLTLKKPSRSADIDESAEKSSAKWSRLAQIAISALILAILGISILSAIPGSVIKNTAAPALVPIARFTGLDQGWGMFAPNPPKANSEIEIHVIMSDGTDHIWRPFEDSGMRIMQWRKFKEEIVKGADFRPGLALWAVRQMTKDNDLRAVRVVMVAQLETIPLPGQGEPQTARKLLLDQTVPAQFSGANK